MADWVRSFYQSPGYQKYAGLSYAIFLAGFFFLPTKAIRSYYYIFVLLPFLPWFFFFGLKKIYQSKILSVALAYCFYMVISLGWANGLDSLEAINYMRKAFLVISFITLTAYLLETSWDRLHLFFQVICWTAAIMGVISSVWYGLFFYEDLAHNGYRMISLGILNFPLTAATCYSFVALISFFNFFLQAETPLKTRVISALVVVTSVSFVLLTHSRGPLLALAVTLLVGVFLWRPKRVVWVFALFSLSFLAAAAIGLFEWADLTRRSDSFRLTIWQQSWDIFKNSPWIGYGLGGERPPITYDHGLAAHAHNLFLSNLLDGGVLSLLPLLVLLGFTACYALRYFVDRKNITLFSLAIFSILANLTDGKVLIVSPNHQWFYFWFPIGIIAAYELHCRSKSDFRQDPAQG